MVKLTELMKPVVCRIPETLRFLLILFIVAGLTVGSLSVKGATPAASSSSGSYNFRFDVNEDGVTQVQLNYTSSGTGESWVFVPKFSEWTNVTLSGRITSWELVETENVADASYYFYQAYKFSFTSDGSFSMRIQFNMSTGALIVEPRGIFFSPQIGFKKGENGQAEVYLPSGYDIDSDKALALGRISYRPTSISSNYVRFNLQENLIRLQVEFSTEKPTPDLVTLTEGIFTFDAVKRYENYANDILNLYNDVYSDLVSLFNVTLQSVKAQFFIPDFDAFLSVGGYVPLETTGAIVPFEAVGDIHINVFFVRAVSGVLEVIATHELVHHFLFEAGISPSDLLWFHEGMAQYVSIEVVNSLGYEGALMEKQGLEDAADQLVMATHNFYFLQGWNPENPPLDVGTYYVAAYYVVSRLAEDYGGLNYYARFFQTLGNGAQITNNDELAYHLSLAANATVVPTLRWWGFDVADLYISSMLIEEARQATFKVYPLFQPYKALAGYFYEQGLISLENNYTRGGNQLLTIAIYLAQLAPVLTLITWAAVLAVVLYLIKRRLNPPKPETPTVEYAPERLDKK